MRAKQIAIGVVVGVLLSSAVVVLAGNLDPSSGPMDAASQMVTLEQVYDRLDAGAADTKMTSFTEPSSGPGTGTMRSLDEIMGIAPAPDDTNGAAPGDVLNGKTYWGLRNSGMRTVSIFCAAERAVAAGIVATLHDGTIWRYPGANW